MKFMLPILLFMAGCGSACAYPAPDYDAARKATVRIEMPNGVCSGTVVAPHVVLSAEHCLQGGQPWRINTRTAKILKIESDGNDHILVTVDLYFKDVAKFGGEPAIGADVYSWGNPAGIAGILLVGRVAGYAEVPPYKRAMVLDRSDWYGMSGSAVFDSRGRIVGVVNAMYPADYRWHLTAIFPLNFTAKQLECLDA